MESPERKENRCGMHPVKRKTKKPERKQTAGSQNGKAGGLTLSKTVLAGSIRAPRAFFQPKFGKD